MPTKLNKAGKQQPYVPKGNGDASGEYGTHTGSNKHFKSFGKKELSNFGKKEFKGFSSNNRIVNDFKKETILESDFSLINLDSYSNSNPILVANDRFCYLPCTHRFHATRFATR